MWVNSFFKPQQQLMILENYLGEVDLYNWWDTRIRDTKQSDVQNCWPPNYRCTECFSAFWCSRVRDRPQSDYITQSFSHSPANTETLGATQSPLEGPLQTKQASISENITVKKRVLTSAWAEPLSCRGQITEDEFLSLFIAEIQLLDSHLQSSRRREVLQIFWGGAADVLRYWPTWTQHCGAGFPAEWPWPTRRLIPSHMSFESDPSLVSRLLYTVPCRLQKRGQTSHLTRPPWERVGWREVRVGHLGSAGSGPVGSFA